MGRKKKEIQETSQISSDVDYLNLPSLGLPNLESAESSIAYPRAKNIRDYDNMLPIEYPKDEIGFIEWRKLLGLEYISLNRSSFAKRGIDINILSKEEIDKYKRESPEEDLMIKLAGFRLLAKIRGFSDISYEIKEFHNGPVCVCKITWIPNIESQYISSTSGVSSASVDNVAKSFQHSLEAIASNRAFIRAVREGLNIFAVGEDEMNPNEEEKVQTKLQGSAFLENICKEKGIEIAVINKFLDGAGLPSKWNSFKEIPDKIALTAVGLMEKKPNVSLKEIESIVEDLTVEAVEQ